MLIHATQEIKSLIPQVFLIIQCGSLHTTCHTLVNLTFAYIALKGTDIKRTGIGNIMFSILCLSTLMQLTLLGHQRYAAQKYTQKNYKKPFIKHLFLY